MIKADAPKKIAAFRKPGNKPDPKLRRDRNNAVAGRTLGGANRAVIFQRAAHMDGVTGLVYVLPAQRGGLLRPQATPQQHLNKQAKAVPVRGENDGAPLLGGQAAMRTVGGFWDFQ